MNLDGLKTKISNLEYMPVRSEKFSQQNTDNNDLLDLKKSVSSIITSSQSKDCKDMKNNIISFNSLCDIDKTSAKDKKRTSGTFISESDSKFTMDNPLKKSSQQDNQLRNTITYSYRNSNFNDLNKFSKTLSTNASDIPQQQKKVDIENTLNKNINSSFSYTASDLLNKIEVPIKSQESVRLSNQVNLEGQEPLTKLTSNNRVDSEDNKARYKGKLKSCLRSKYIVNNYQRQEVERKDIYGVVIDQLRKNHKVSFADNVNNDLTVIKKVKSYIKINRLNSYEPSSTSYEPACLEFCSLF